MGPGTMEPRAYLELIGRESALFHRALEASDLTVPVPSCPDWNGADLAWHLAEVHHFWRFVVDHRPEPPEGYVDPERPSDDELIAFGREQAEGLIASLGAARPEDACWSWAEGGDSIAWAMRRQAHEALIHRVDAQLVAGQPVDAPDAEVAADGVDELVHVFLGDVPSWGSFTADGRTIALMATDADERWQLELGRFTGTSPNSGRSYDETHARPAGTTSPDATLRGSSWALDLWLWGRGRRADLEVVGDAALADQLRTIVSDSSQ